LAVNNDNEDRETVEEILQDVEGPARQERRKHSNAIALLVAILLVAAAVYWLFN
jgi:hypothetical protein